MSMGGGSISISFDVSFPTGWQVYTQTLFSVVYPEIVKIYAYPSNTITITVKYDPSTGGWNWYDSGAKSITMGFLPTVTPPATNDPSWDAVFTHELIHGFHDAILAGGGLPASWAEEGMTEAATEIVAMNIQGSRNIIYRNPIDNLCVYDEWSYLGGDVVGGTTYSYYKIIPDMFYRLAPSMFWILTTELSTDPANPYDFLKRLNTRLYTIGSYIDDTAFKSAVRFVAGSTLVEGNFADVWITSQPISNVQGGAGPRLGVYTWYPENLWNVQAFVFNRVVDQDNPWNTQEQAMPGVSVTIQVFDSAGSQVATFSGATDSYGTTSWFNLGSTYPLAFGAYRIVATATGGGLGSTLTSINYARGTGTSWYISGPDTSVYGVVIDSLGRPVVSTVSVTGATLQTCLGGSFIVQPSSTSTRSEFTINGIKIIAKPTPYTRVVWSPPFVFTQIPGATSSPAALVSDGSEFYLVVRGTDNGIYYRATAGGSWTGSWRKILGATNDVPTIVVLDGKLHLVVRGVDNGIYHGYVDLTTGSWSGWTRIPGATISSSGLATSSGVLHLAVRGTDNGIYYRPWTESGGWSGAWQKIPGATNDVPAIVALGTNLHLVVRGIDNGIYHSMKDLSGGSPSPWTKLPGATVSSPTLVGSGTDRLDLVVRGTDDGIYHRVWSTGSGWISTWEAIPGATNDKPTLAVAGSSLILAVRGTDNRIYYKTMDLVSGAWSSWIQIPGATPSYPALAASSTRIDIVVRGTDNGIYYAYWMT